MKKINYILLIFVSTVLLTMPIKTFAATNYVIYNDDSCEPRFYYDAYKIAEEVTKYYNKYIEKRSTYKLIPCSCSDDFIEAWNKISDDCNVGMIIIEAHGSPYEIYNNHATFLTIDDVPKLNYISCDYLFMTCCNVAHLNFFYKNISCALFKKISGKLIASDGTVYPAASNGNKNSANTVSYTSGASETWKKYVTDSKMGNRTTNAGWLIYSHVSTYDSVIHIDYDYPSKTVTVYSLMNYLLTGDIKVTPKRIS